MVKFFLLWILTIPTFFVNAQNKISLVKSGKITHLTLHEKATFQNVNGQISIAIIASNNMLIQLNNLNSGHIKCGKRTYSSKPKLVLIDNQNNTTYVSTTYLQILSVCTNKKNEFKITFSGVVKNKNEKITINGTLLVTKLPQENTTTTH
jgi:hypothetical protein